MPSPEPWPPAATVDGATGVDLDVTKADGSQHRVLRRHLIERTDAGLWIGGVPGDPAWWGRSWEPADRVTVGFVPLVGWWMATWWQSDGPEPFLYVDIGRVLSVDDGLVRFVDLDLDLAGPASGPWRLLDEDEFAEHRIRFGYDEATVAGAWGGVAEVRRTLEQGGEFGAAFAEGARRLTEWSRRLGG